MYNRRKLGSIYEEKAALFLKEKGYEIIQNNYQCRLGEIDIIARHNGYLVFVEVKYRKSIKYGHPVEAVDFKKRKNICQVAQQYLVRYGRGMNVPIRFDVVTILGEKIDIYENAFEFCV